MDTFSSSIKFHTMRILEIVTGFCILHANPLIECEQLLCISYFLFLRVVLCMDVYINMA